MKAFILLLCSLILNINELSSKHLELFGKIKHFAKFSDTYKDSEKASISIVDLETGIKFSSVSNDEGAYSIKLDLNKIFMLKVYKNGWISKTVSVSTKLPKESEGIYKYNFDMEMFEEISIINASILKEKFDEIFFNNNLMHFSYKLAITPDQNDHLCKQYNEYYLKHKAKSTEPVSAQPNMPVVTVKSTTAPVSNNNTTKQAKVVYQIQIVTLSGHTPYSAKVFEGCGSISEYVVNGKYKYTVGEYYDLESALKDVNKYKAKGFSDAFPVTIVNGQLEYVPGYPTGIAAK